MKANEKQKVYAIGVVIESGDGKILYAKRSKKYAHEYKGFWSIPTLPIYKKEYYEIKKSKNLSYATTEKFSKKRLNGIPLIGGRLLISGTRQRSKYLLNISLFSGRLAGTLPEKTLKYDKFKFLSPSQLLSTTRKKIGTCISLCFQNLINKGILPSTTKYLEIPPEIANLNKKFEDYSSEDLWKLASPNYSLLLKGQTGGEGHLIRKLTLDKFLESFINQEIKQGVKLLDLGCGDASFLKKASSKTEFCFGLDYKSSPLKQVKIGNLYNAPNIFKNIRFDWVVLNLMLHLISNLNDAVRSIRYLLKKEGKVLTTITTPEFTKNGQWIENKGEYNWLITKPIRRGKTLEMINRSVGPIWFYHRSTVDILSIFGRNGLFCIDGQHIYIDTYLHPEKFSNLLKTYPSLIRHKMLPIFTILKFIKA